MNAGRTITISMATFNPDPDLFRVQIDSIRSQDDSDWICVISDDASDPEHFAAIEAELEGDDRFLLSRSERRLGFYRNFERALELVPAESGPVALSDQDDRWHPDKLSVLRRALGSAQLVYSDQRLVTEDGRVIAESYWGRRRNNFTNLTSLLIANTVTGAAALFRRDLLDLALPFPEVPGEQYHDQWLALVGLTVGELVYVDRPLYDYVQHDNAVLGHAAANVGLQSLGWKRLDLRRAREIFGGWGSAYFDVYLRLQALAELLLNRCGERITPRKRRSLERFVKASKDPLAMPWMALRPLRRLAGRNETLGSERVIARALAYRHITALRSRLPGKLGGSARRVRLGGTSDTSVSGIGEVDRMRRKIQPIALGVDPKEAKRVNLLIPTIDLEHLFGGYIAKFNLARRLSEAGHRVRIVTVDPTAPPAGWQEKVEAYDGLGGLFDRVEIAFGREAGLLAVNPEDTFIATTWWTALIAEELLPQTSRSKFVYLIQEYEPLTVPPGSWAALAESSYRTAHFGLFSTGILQSYFRERRIGVFRGDGDGDANSIPFRNAVTPVDPPASSALQGRAARRLLFYARPEPHAARNMFELGLLSLQEAVASRRFGPEWEFHGIGSIGGGRSVDLGNATELVLRPRTDQAAYGSMLASHDIGLALMYAPHPSLVPIEMASAGLLTVTNSYETKTAASMAAISDNLITAEPDPKSIAGALAAAADRAGDFEARAAGARIDWPSDWDQALDAAVIARVSKAIEDA